MQKFYEELLFFQGDEANEILEFFEAHSVEETIDYLCNWVCDGGEIRTEKPWGRSDNVFKTDDGYVLSVNSSIGYIGLCRIVDKDYVYYHKPQLLESN